MPIRPTVPLPGPFTYVPQQRQSAVGATVLLFIGLPLFLAWVLVFGVLVLMLALLLLSYGGGRLLGGLLTRRRQDPRPERTSTENRMR